MDAATGELLAFVDTNAYAARRVVGGVYPFSNDQRPPDGIEQPGWPMPFLDVTVGGNPLTTTTGGTFACSAGVATAALSGPFARINDGCGADQRELGRRPRLRRQRRHATASSPPATRPATPTPRGPRSTR